MESLADIFNVPTGLKGPDGKEYKLRKLTLYEQGEFQRWLEKRAHDAIDRGPESQAAKDKRHDRVYADSAAGKYEWDGPVALEAMWTPAGMAKVIAIVCRDQGVTDETAEAILNHTAREAATIILTRAAKDPKALSPLLGALGLPMDWMESAASEPSCNASSTRPSTEPSPNSPDSATSNSSSSTPSREAPMG